MVTGFRNLVSKWWMGWVNAGKDLAEVSIAFISALILVAIFFFADIDSFARIILALIVIGFIAFVWFKLRRWC